MKYRPDHIPLSRKDKLLIADCIKEANDHNVKLLLFVQSKDTRYQARKAKIQALILDGVDHPVQYARYTWDEADKTKKEMTHLLKITIEAFTGPGDHVIEVFSNPDNGIVQNICEECHRYKLGYFFYNKASQLI